MGKFTNLYQKVEELAKDLFAENEEDFFEKLKEQGTNFDYEDYFGDKAHEDIDREFIYVGLVDSAEIIEGAQSVETDSGLWEGQDPEAAILTMAFFTLKNEVMSELRDIVRGELENKKDELEGEMNNLENDRQFNKERMQAKGKRFTEIEDDEEYEDEAEELEEEITGLQDELDAIDEQVSDLEDFIYVIDELHDNI